MKKIKWKKSNGKNQNGNKQARSGPARKKKKKNWTVLQAYNIKRIGEAKLKILDETPFLDLIWA